jgi:tetrachlorobenzoquinone reductase
MPKMPQQQVLVRSLRYEAQDVVSVELTPPDGTALAPFTAGSHVDLHLPGGLTRCYSLLNPEWESGRYVIGVYRDPQSRGGSSYVHDLLRVGQWLSISEPRNNFPIAAGAVRHVLIAGGIGVTPFCSMVESLAVFKRPWTLYYCAQTSGKAAFQARIRTLSQASGGEVIFNFDGEPGGRLLDLAEVVAREAEDVHFYCCGPSGMLEAFTRACAGRAKSHVHVEHFAADTDLAVEGGFTVVLGRSGQRIPIPPGGTILDVLIARGVNVSYSCRQGICGACEVKVLAGEPDHRDQILSDAERDASATMMICCSGSKGAELVIDL